MARDKEIAITPDFNNSALTFGPTFSTLLKLNLFPKDLSRFTFISSITFSCYLCFQILLSNLYHCQIF